MRADSGFCRDALVVWCGRHAVHYLFGLARHPVLEATLARGLEQARTASQQNGGATSRVFIDFASRDRSWPAPPPAREKPLGEFWRAGL